jgi:hypothetical protein
MTDDDEIVTYPRRPFFHLDTEEHVTIGKISK